MMKINLTILLFCITTYLSFGQTIIPDNSNVSGTWDLNGSPYIIEGRAFILASDNLTIQPGVEVRFDASTSYQTSTFDFGNGFVGALKVEGTLNAQGTISNNILFTRDGSNGYWGAIIVDQTGTLEMDYCTIEYGKESRYVPGISGVVSFPGALSFYQNTNSCIVKNSVFKNNRIDGVYAIYVPNYDVKIDDNIIHSNGRNGVYSVNSSILIRNNELYNNATDYTGTVAAINISQSDSYAVGNLIHSNNQFGFRVNASSNIITHIVNNTIYDHSQGIRIENAANIELYNNILYGNTTTFATGTSSGTINARNNLTNETALPTVFNDLGGNLLSSNPEFVNVSTDSFHIEAISPCIDNGYADTSNLYLLELDLLDNDRVDNGTIDIGAIEYQSPIMYSVVTSVNPINGGITTGDGSYTENSSVTVEATANVGYVFVNWTENGNVVSTDSQYIFTISDNRNLQANFDVVNYTITTTENPATGGTTTGAGTYQEGSQVTVEATANVGYVFVNWTENGSVVSTDGQYIFTISDNRNLQANFDVVNYTVTTTENPVAGGTTTGAGSYQEGDEVTVSAIPETNYALVNWTENGTVVSTNDSYTFTIQSNRDLVANFELVTSVENEIMESILIYPNPASSYIQIESSREWKSYIIRGLDGKVVQQNLYSESVDVSNLSNGTYYLEIIDDLSIIRKKFIKITE